MGSEVSEPAQGGADASVTIAVVSWNTSDLLDRCLKSLRPCVESGLARVVVVDNGSADGSPAMVAGHHPWAELIEADANLGFGRAVNRAVQDATSEWIAAANADVEVSTGALEALVARGTSNPACAAVAPRLEGVDGSTQPSVYRFPSVCGTALASVGAHRVSEQAATAIFHGPIGDWSHEAEVDWAMGAFLLVRREAFNAVGGFDETQWMYAEDLDLCWRLAQAGWRTRYVPTATVHHVGAASATAAFGAGHGTLPVVAAHFAWLKRRRGPAMFWSVVMITMLATVARIIVYRAEAFVRRRGGSNRLNDAVIWLGLVRRAVRSTLLARPDTTGLPREHHPS